MIDQKKFCENACELYFKYKHKHQTDDWEQEYFDAMWVLYDNKNEHCMIHLYYWDDETIGSATQSMLDDFTGKKILYSTSFDDEDLETTVVVAIVEK